VEDACVGVTVFCNWFDYCCEGISISGKDIWVIVSHGKKMSCLVILNQVTVSFLVLFCLLYFLSDFFGLLSFVSFAGIVADGPKWGWFRLSLFFRFKYTFFFFFFFNYFNVKNKILKINKIFKIFPTKKHFQKSKTIYIIISNIHLTWCLILWYVLHMWF